MSRGNSTKKKEISKTNYKLLLQAKIIQSLKKYKENKIEKIN